MQNISSDSIGIQLLKTGDDAGFSGFLRCGRKVVPRGDEQSVRGVPAAGTGTKFAPQSRWAERDGVRDFPTAGNGIGGKQRQEPWG